MEYDLIVIGGGPGGYVAAIRAAQLGMKTALVDKNEVLGGTCLRVGCIPSKALLESTEVYHLVKDGLSPHGIQASGVELNLQTLMARKEKIVTLLSKGIEGLLKKNKIERFVGAGRILAPGLVGVSGANPDSSLRTKNILIATGSKSSSLAGIEADGERALTSTEALSLKEIPEHLAVIGAGAIGLELGSVWRRLGSKVTVLEYLDRILPGMDKEIAGEAQKVYQKQGFDFILGAKVSGIQREPFAVKVEGRDPLPCSHVLLSVGRGPFTEGLGLETLGLQLDPRGRIPVDAHFETSAKGVFAIGDVIAGPMLAHKAEEEGTACVEGIATGYGHVNYDAIPAVVYTHPEVAGVGKTEEQLVEAKAAYRKSSFPFRANGRAHSLGSPEGKVKMLADEKTDRILGVHILGPRAGDLIAEASVAMDFQATAEDLARSVHSHPSLSETLKEAALGISGRMIHF